MKNERKGIKLPLSLTAAVLDAALLLSFSVAVPLLWRGFYYMQIKPLGLLAYGTEEMIRQSYDEMLDYCIGLRETFSLSQLPWSASAASHFADARFLFLLDLRVLAVSALGRTALAFFGRGRKRLTLCGRTPSFWASVSLGGIFLLLAALAAADFSRAFTLFHRIFFPGKDNWIFHAESDPIILLLPERFFCRCAILSVSILFFGCTVSIAADRRRKKRERTESV